LRSVALQKVVASEPNHNKLAAAIARPLQLQDHY